MMQGQHVVVVGGGIAGMAAAEHLGTEGWRVTLVEASPRLGGIIRTEHTDDGLLMEWGPDSMLASKEAGVQLAERMGIANRLHGTAPDVHGAYVLHAGALHRLPEGMSGLVPTRIASLASSTLLSWPGKMRMMLDRVLPAVASSDDESIERFAVRRFGREAYHRLIEPLLTGIYAGDGARLSVLSTFPQLRDAERRYGSVMRGLRPAPGASPRRGFVSFASGMEELVHAVRARLEAIGEERGQLDVRTGTMARRVELREGGVGVDTGQEMIRADAVVLAVPARAAAGMLRALDRDLAGHLDEIEYGSVATVSLAYAVADVPRRLDATGYIVPPAEGRPVLACTWSSAKFPGRAPSSMALFRMFIGGPEGRSIINRDDAHLLAVAQAELRATIGVSGVPVEVRVHRHIKAMPQYHLGHRERAAAIECRLAAMPSVALAGSSYHGVGIPDCIASGIRAARRVTRALLLSTNHSIPATT